MRRPALVIWGAHDPYLPVDRAWRQDVAFPDADVRVFDDSGHWPFIDAAERCATLITDFLKSVVWQVEEPSGRRGSATS